MVRMSGKLKKKYINYVLMLKRVPHFLNFFKFEILFLPGKRNRQPRCVRAIDKQQVSNSRCDQRTRPSSVSEPCNLSCVLE